MRSKVDLPTPFGPTTPRRVRGPMDRLIRSRINLVPRRKVTALADSTAGDPIAGVGLDVGSYRCALGSATRAAPARGGGGRRGRGGRRPAPAPEG